MRKSIFLLFYVIACRQLLQSLSKFSNIYKAFLHHIIPHFIGVNIISLSNSNKGTFKYLKLLPSVMFYFNFMSIDVVVVVGILQTCLCIANPCKEISSVNN